MENFFPGSTNFENLQNFKKNIGIMGKNWVKKKKNSHPALDLKML